jgi:hypothetical protein
MHCDVKLDDALCYSRFFLSCIVMSSSIIYMNMDYALCYQIIWRFCCLVKLVDAFCCLVKLDDVCAIYVMLMMQCVIYIILPAPVEEQSQQSTNCQTMCSLRFWSDFLCTQLAYWQYQCNIPRFYQILGEFFLFLFCLCWLKIHRDLKLFSV